ncbi:MAG: hypothetical protein AAF696_08625 [Bacteroidota bacterium]
MKYLLLFHSSIEKKTKRSLNFRSELRAIGIFNTQSDRNFGQHTGFSPGAGILDEQTIQQEEQSIPCSIDHLFVATQLHECSKGIRYGLIISFS